MCDQVDKGHHSESWKLETQLSGHPSEPILIIYVSLQKKNEISKE